MPAEYRAWRWWRFRVVSEYGVVTLQTRISKVEPVLWRSVLRWGLCRDRDRCTFCGRLYPELDPECAESELGARRRCR